MSRTDRTILPPATPTGFTPPLRPYQREAIEAVCEAALEKAGAPVNLRGIVQFPTGGGKTYYGLTLGARLGRTVWCTHRDELVKQPLRTARAFWPDKSLGVIKGAKQESAARDFVFVSVASGAKPERLDDLVRSQEIAGEVKLVVADECQHAFLGSQFDRVLAAFPRAIGLGLSATPERTDRRPLTKVFPDGLLYALKIKAAIEGRYLVPVTDGETRGRARRVVYPEFRPADVKLNKAGTDYDEDDLAEKLRDSGKALARAAAEAVKLGRRVMVFTIRRVLSEEIARVLREQHDIPALHVDMDTPEEVRDRVAQDLTSGTLRVASSVDIYGEGTDIPAVDAIVMGRPTRSRVAYVQRIGRGLRPFPGPLAAHDDEDGKKDCLVYDLVGADAAHGGLRTVSALFDEDDDTPQPMPRRKRDGASVALLPGGGDLRDRLTRLLEYVSGDRDVEAVDEDEAQLEWVVVPNGTLGPAYALELGDKKRGMVLVEPLAHAPGLYDVILEPENVRDAPVALAYEPVPYDLGQTIAENHARQAGVLRILKRDASWRRRPASQGQLGYLRALGVRVDPGTEEHLRAGEAGRLIARAKAAIRTRTRASRPPVRRQRVWSEF